MTLSTYLHAKRGRVTTLAGLMRVSVALVSMWASGDRVIPAKRCFEIRRWTGVPLKFLRPDVFGRKS